MTSTEPLRTIHRYSTGPVPCDKIVVPRGLTSACVTAAMRARSSAPTASNGGREPRKSATLSAGSASVTGPGQGSGGFVGDADRRRDGTGAVLGQHAGRAAAELGDVVDDAHAAEQAGEDKRAPLEVPVVGAVDRRARPGEVD